MSEDKAKYDKNIKELLAHKDILAWIVKGCCKEFHEMTIPDIKACIEGDVRIASIAVYPGETNAKIAGSATEDSVLGEGVVTYDIRFRIKTLQQEMREIIINIEAQKDYYPGYPLESRGVFYCARMISSQMDVDFTEPHYGDIKKVYSIWLCTEPPKHEGNSITTYSIEQNNLFGNHLKTDAADLLEVVLVCLREEAEETTELHEMLNTLLSSKIKPIEKKKRMEKRFGIAVSKTFGEGLENLCNLSSAIEAKGIERGIAKGIEQGIERGIAQGIEQGAMLKVLDLVRKHKFSLEEAAEELSCTVAEVEKLMRENGYQS